MSIKLACIYEAHHCVSWLTVDSVLQYLGPAPVLQQRLWRNISEPAAHSASPVRTPGQGCLAKLISGSLSVTDAVSNSLCSTEEQKALHCPPQPILWAQPPPTDPVLAARVSDLLAAGQSAPHCLCLEGNGEVSCHLQQRFVMHCLCRHHPSPERHMYCSQSSPRG